MGIAMAGNCRRRLVIDLLATGTSLPEIVAATGYRPRTIRQIAQRYRASGPASLEDRRVHSRGALPLIPAVMQDELRKTLQDPPPGGGCWTGPKVAQWIAVKAGKPVHRQRGWEYLRRLKGAALPADIVELAVSSPRDDVEQSA
jgi:transposase